jgi:hypothetical protein
MICCDLLLAWFCNYDFDMISLMILIWIKIVILMWVKSGLKITWLNLENIPETYQNHIKFAQNRIKTVSKPDQHHIKSYQNISKPQKPSRNWPKACPRAVFFPCLKPTHREPWKGAPFPNHIETISKPSSKPYWTHHKTISRHQNPKFKAHQSHILKSWIKTILKSLQQISLEFGFLEGFDVISIVCSCLLLLSFTLGYGFRSSLTAITQDLVAPVAVAIAAECWCCLRLERSDQVRPRNAWFALCVFHGPKR